MPGATAVCGRIKTEVFSLHSPFSDEDCGLRLHATSGSGSWFGFLCVERGAEEKKKKKRRTYLPTFFAIF
jgi:hypothetical protein